MSFRLSVDSVYSKQTLGLPEFPGTSPDHPGISRRPGGNVTKKSRGYPRQYYIPDPPRRGYPRPPGTSRAASGISPAARGYPQPRRGYPRRAARRALDRLLAPRKAQAVAAAEGVAAVEEVLQAEPLGVHGVALSIILVKKLRQVRPARNKEPGEWAHGGGAGGRGRARARG